MVVVFGIHYCYLRYYYNNNKTHKLSLGKMETMSTDNDDVCSVESFDSTSYDVASSPSNERDEYQEVEKSTQDDTIRLQLWRVIVTIVLLSCTLAVTVTTYYVLEAENESNFSNAVRGWIDG